MIIGGFQRNSLKTRVTLFTLVIFVISIWSLALYARQLLRQDMQGLLGEQQYSTVTLVASTIDHELSDRLAALEKVAAGFGPAALADAAMLQKNLEMRPVFQELFNAGAFVTGPDGVAIASVPLAAQRQGVAYLDRDSIVSALKGGKAVISRPVIGRRSGIPLIAMAAPILDARGAVIGAVIGVTSLGAPNFLDKLLANGYGKSGGYLLVAPQQRLIVTASDKSRSMEILPGPGISPTLDRFIAGHQGTETFVNPLGVEVLASVKAIPAAGWYVAGTLPTTEVFAPIRITQQRMLLVTLVLTVLAGGLTWWMLRRQLAPLQSAARSLAALSDENQPLRVIPVAREDEIGQMVGGFNRLVGTLVRREAALQARETRLQLLFEGATDGIMIRSPDGVVVAVNESFARLHGYTKEEILRLDLNRLEAAENLRLAPERIGRILAGERLTFEVERYHRDGHVVALEVSASLIVDQGQALIQSFHRDITERNRHQTEQLLLARRAQALLDLPGAADSRDEQTFLQYGLALAENLTGSKIAFAHFVLENQETIELLTWSPDTLAHYCQAKTEHHYAISEAGIWADALRQRAPLLINDYASAPGRHGLPEGHARLQRLISVPVIDAGLVRMMVGIGNKPQPYTEMDVETTRLIADALWRIVHQRRADAALRKSQESLKEAQYIASLGSYVLDLSTGRWESSEALDHLFGIDAGYERSVEGWEALIHRDDRAMMDDYFRYDVVVQLNAFNKEYRITRYDDGTERWVIGLGHLEFDAQGQPWQMHGTIQDITDLKQAEAALRRSEERYRTAFMTSPDGIIVNRLADGLYLDVNDGFLRLVGWTRDEVIGKTSKEVNIWRDIDDRTRSAQTLQQDGFFENIEVNLVAKDAKSISALMSMHVTTLDGVPCVFSVIRDITDQKQVESKLLLAASVFSHAREAIMITSADGLILDVNDTFTQMTGFAGGEVLGRNPRMLASGRQDKEFYAAMWGDLLGKGHWYGEIWNRRKNGEIYPTLQTISAVLDAKGRIQHYVALFSDITALKEHQKELEHVAHFDILTNLPNRVLLADRLQQAMIQCQRRGQRVAVIYLDLDGFKSINDRHGHEAGDQLLISLASCMKQVLREGDTLARLGGDEFVAVLLDLADIDASVPLLTRLLGAASQPVQIGPLSLQVSASVGVTFYPQAQDMDADQVLRQADQAMYQAKLAGKNRFHVFDADQDRSVRGHHESLARIAQALDGHEFVLHYQPKVNMRSGRVIGVEALIRWQHPELGLLAPAVFLPDIEDHRMSVAVGEWVIETALAQVELWHAAGLEIAVSVNVGARQLQQLDFVDRLSAILRQHPQVDPSWLELEILETSALEDVSQVSQVIEDCARLGVSFALDDFGTGYSSLSYLKRLRVALLKIDKSFVCDMLEDPDDLAMLESVISMAAAFKRRVIAEGVETVAHGTLLLKLGCELAQGYGIARPMPAEDLPAWVAAWQSEPDWFDAAGTVGDNRPREGKQGSSSVLAALA
ncbi:MAG: EAL domain-containing protein [Rhodoferax sp.]